MFWTNRPTELGTHKRYTVKLSYKDVEVELRHK